MADIVNGRCYNEKAPDQSPPLIQHGKLVLQGQHTLLVPSLMYRLSNLYYCLKPIMYDSQTGLLSY